MNCVYGCNLVYTLLEQHCPWWESASVQCCKLWVANVKLELQRTDMAQPVKKCHN